MAETTTWRNVGSTPIRMSVFDRGEYTSLDRIIIKMDPNLDDCYFVDPADFNATLNGNLLETPIALYKDDKGHAKQFIYIIDESKLRNEGEENIFRINQRVKYINKNNPEEILFTATSNTSVVNIRFKITPYSTLESASSWTAPGKNHNELVTYLYDKPAGEDHTYDYLLGDFGFSLNNIYTGFWREIDTQIKPYVIDKAGNFITKCTDNSGRSSLYSDTDVTFKVIINQAITEPGEYYIVYPTAGVFRFRQTTYNDCNHYANFKIGPYIVRESTGETTPAIRAQTEWLSPGEFVSDQLPDSIYLKITNASVIARRNNGASTNYYQTHVTYNNNDSYVSSIIAHDNIYAIALPSGWYKGVGQYTLTITKPADIFDAMSADSTPIEFSNDEPLQMTFTVNAPSLPEAVDFYVRPRETSTYALAEGETVNVRLMHADQALGLKIFVKWTPDANASEVMAKAPADFVEHNEDVEISSPGTLQYYSTRGGTTSATKTISIVRSNDVSTGLKAPEIMNNIPSEEGIYNLSGVRVSDTPAPGIYIRRLSDGTARKVIVR